MHRGPCRSYVTLAAGFSFVSCSQKHLTFIPTLCWPCGRYHCAAFYFFRSLFFLAHYFSILRCFWCWSPLRPPTVFSCFSSSTCLLLRRNFLQETALDDIPPRSKYFLSQRQWCVIPCVMWEMQTWNNIDWLIYWQQVDQYVSKSIISLHILKHICKEMIVPLEYLCEHLNLNVLCELSQKCPIFFKQLDKPKICPIFIMLPHLL